MYYWFALILQKTACLLQGWGKSIYKNGIIFFKVVVFGIAAVSLFHKGRVE